MGTVGKGVTGVRLSLLEIIFLSNVGILPVHFLALLFVFSH